MVVNKTADRLPSGALYSSQGREITNNQKIVNKSRSINALWKKQDRLCQWQASVCLQIRSSAENRTVGAAPCRLNAGLSVNPWLGEFFQWEARRDTGGQEEGRSQDVSPSPSHGGNCSGGSFFSTLTSATTTAVPAWPGDVSAFLLCSSGEGGRGQRVGAGSRREPSGVLLFLTSGLLHCSLCLLSLFYHSQK